MVGLGRFGHLPFDELFLEHLAQEGDAGQMLTESIVEILADPAIFLIADLEHRFLQAPSFRFVAAGGDDVFRRPVRVRDDGAGPGDPPVGTGPRHPCRFAVHAGAPARRRIQRRPESLALVRRDEQIPEKRAFHVFGATPGGELTGAIEADDAAGAVEHDDQRAHGVEDRREQVALFLKRRFRQLQVRDVERDALDEPGSPVATPHDLGFALEPDDVAVPRDHAVDRSEGVPRQEHGGGILAPALFLVRMDLVVPADRIFQPLLLRESQRRFDLRADIRFADAAIQIRHEHDRRHLLEERAVSRLEDRGVIRQFLVGRRGARRRVETRQQAQRVLRLAEIQMTRRDHRRVRHCGSLFMDAIVKRRSAWIARP